MLFSHGKKSIEHSKYEGIQVKEALQSGNLTSLRAYAIKNPDVSALICVCVILSMSYYLLMLTYSFFFNFLAAVNYLKGIIAANVKFNMSPACEFFGE
jgi:hypothetical protein